MVIDVESRDCPCCGGALHAIDELRTEQLDIVPAQLRVRVTRRPRYACRACEGAVVVAPAPERPIDGGMATEALIAHVVVSKFCDSLPLYRQAQMLARQGVTLDRSTLSNWVGRACWWLTPLYDLVVGTVLSSDKLFADDTTLPVLDPGRGRTKTGRLWCYAVDDRPWCGPDSSRGSLCVFRGPQGRRVRPDTWPTFRGVLQVDGYAGFKRLAGDRADESVTPGVLLGAHAAALLRVPCLHEVAACRRGAGAHPRALRDRGRDPRPSRRSSTGRYGRSEVDRSWRPCMPGCRITLERVSAVSDLAKAIRYAIRHWPGLIVFLDDGRVEMDTNVVERAIRPHTLTRKNALFAGSDGGARHWAIAMTLIQTAKLNGVDPMAWLTDVLERVVSGRTKAHELHTLLPWNWCPINNAGLAEAA